jgi:hypothetical protein
VRHDLLARLLPKLVIRDVARLGGRFLRVADKLRTYKIHLAPARSSWNPRPVPLRCPGPRRRPGPKCVSPVRGRPRPLGDPVQGAPARQRRRDRQPDDHQPDQTSRLSRARRVCASASARSSSHIAYLWRDGAITSARTLSVSRETAVMTCHDVVGARERPLARRVAGERAQIQVHADELLPVHGLRDLTPAAAPGSRRSGSAACLGSLTQATTGSRWTPRWTP